MRKPRCSPCMLCRSGVRLSNSSDEQATACLPSLKLQQGAANRPLSASAGFPSPGMLHALALSLDGQPRVADVSQAHNAGRREASLLPPAIACAMAEGGLHGCGQPSERRAGGLEGVQSDLGSADLSYPVERQPLSPRHSASGHVALTAREIPRPRKKKDGKHLYPRRRLRLDLVSIMVTTIATTPITGTPSPRHELGRRCRHAFFPALPALGGHPQRNVRRRPARVHVHTRGWAAQFPLGQAFRPSLGRAMITNTTRADINNSVPDPMSPGFILNT
jgi:hypothetical protein